MNNWKSDPTWDLVKLGDIMKKFRDMIASGEWPPPPKPCQERKPGQILVRLNCAACQYAHERWVYE